MKKEHGIETTAPTVKLNIESGISHTEAITHSI